jgi:hypothetical protein
MVAALDMGFPLASAVLVAPLDLSGADFISTATHGAAIDG